jgi:hypothetical protein
LRPLRFLPRRHLVPNVQRLGEEQAREQDPRFERRKQRSIGEVREWTELRHLLEKSALGVGKLEFPGALGDPLPEAHFQPDEGKEEPFEPLLVEGAAHAVEDE